MLGDVIGTSSGKATGQRVLGSVGGGATMETTFQATGKLLKVDTTETGTYTATMRADGSLYGNGHGIIMGKRGESATWVGGGVGTIRKDGSVAYRGAIYYQSSSAAWKRLNKVAAVYEYEVDRNGNTTGKLWEWK